MTASLLGRLALAGVLSTMSMDLGAALARKLGFTHGVPPALIARWFGHLFKGQLLHRNIAEASEAGSLPLVLGLHYLIGLTLTAVFWVGLAQLSQKPVPASTIALLAVGFGVLTNALPWLLMFPAMGFGVFGKDAPAELMLLRSSFVNHVFFGVGLMWTSLVFAKGVRS